MTPCRWFRNGYPKAVATKGTNGLDPGRLEGTNIKRVWMCFDNDEAGRERGIKVAYGCADAGAEVRIIELPDGLDPNDFFLKYSAEDFKLLIQHAKTPEQWEIEHISENWTHPLK